MPGPSFNWNQYPTTTAQDSRTITAPGTPYGTQPGSQDTGVAGPNPSGGQVPVPSGGMSTMPMTPRPPLTWDPNAQQIDPNSLPNLTSPTGQTGTVFGAGASMGATQDPQAFFNQLFPGQSLSPEMLAQHEQELKAQGITIIRNAAGQPSKIRLPDGSVVDPIIGAGSGQNQKAWNVVAGAGGAPIGGNVNGSAGAVLGGLGYAPADWMAKFQDPTADQALNSPGMQFALSEANRMGQNSAAAKGTLLNGRFQQALNASNIQNALQGYQGVYDRAYQTFTRNQDAPFQKNFNLATLGAPK